MKLDKFIRTDEKEIVFTRKEVDEMLDDLIRNEIKICELKDELKTLADALCEIDDKNQVLIKENETLKQIIAVTEECKKWKVQ